MILTRVVLILIISILVLCTFVTSINNNLVNALTQNEESGIKIIEIVKDAPSKTDKAFAPSPMSVVVGQKVKWVNNDSQVHTVTSGTGANDVKSGMIFDSKSLAASSYFEYTFQKPGQYMYYCQFHPQMIGKIIVS